MCGDLISVNKDLIESIVLLIIAMILILIYGIFIIIDERKKWNKKEFFKYTLYYEVDYFLYMDMVKKMKKVLFKKVLFNFMTDRNIRYMQH